MNHRLLPLAALCLLALPSAAQELRRAAPPEVPPLAPPASRPLPEAPARPAAGDAVRLLDALAGLVVVSDAEPASLQRLGSGVDVTAVPLADTPAMRQHLAQAIGQPVSLASLQRLAQGMGRILREQGHAFVSVWVPPQDLTAGVARVVVRPATVEGPVQVVGARHFSPEAYQAWIRQRPGVAPDIARLQADIAWINRNPFRSAVLAAEPGTAPDTTRLSLRVQEREPLRVFAGVENNGTPATGRNRLFAGANWGNAFGRGDQASYQLRMDPEARRSITHSGDYQMDLPWRHVLAASGAWSRSDPDLGPDFRQRGTTWQLGLRYRIPDAWRSGAWTGSLAAGLDAKYADNNLEFSATPVFGTVTRIAQAVLQADVRHDRGENGTTSATLMLVLSPGGTGSRNTDEAFAPSRQGAPARYAYGRLDLDHRQRLQAGWTWATQLSLQWTGVPLLGSEQIAAGGATLRGYPESAAFGDRGAAWMNEWHAPGFALPSGGQGNVFAFVDAATLQTRGTGAESLRLASLGLGTDVSLGANMSARVLVGFPLLEPPGRSFPAARVQARLNWAF